MTTSEVIALEKEHIMQTYGRAPMVLVKGHGAYVWDADGKEYLDFLAGIAVNSLGHTHPRVVAALQEQAAKLIHTSNLYYTEPQARLAEILTRISGLDRVFFANSGAEANEGAIKLARKYAKTHFGAERYEIIVTTHSFHGRTLATLAATGQTKYHKGFEPLPPGFIRAEYNDLESVRAAVTERTGAILVEPFQGESGIHPASREFMAGLDELRREKGILLIFDEIQSGLGRTGKLFAFEHYGIKPDILTLAKALGGGVPIGAFLARQEVAEALGPGDHGSTFGGNPLATAAGLAAVSALLEEKLPERAARVGEYFFQRLQGLARRYPAIKEIRGKGLMIGIELDFECKGFVESCRQKGLLLNCTEGKVLRLVPPLIIGEAEVDKAVAILETVFQEGAESQMEGKTSGGCQG
ncbi:MAG: acetylornithine transaminase [Firmicutes bacterium]|nr:acetylornithine transaminase [Bacillota bacterium]MCL5040398.1 acetylornithine transaminase [Bacillota bacterium]